MSGGAALIGTISSSSSSSSSGVTMWGGVQGRGQSGRGWRAMGRRQPRWVAEKEMEGRGESEVGKKGRELREASRERDAMGGACARDASPAHLQTHDDDASFEPTCHTSPHSPIPRLRPIPGRSARALAAGPAAPHPAATPSRFRFQKVRGGCGFHTVEGPPCPIPFQTPTCPCSLPLTPSLCSLPPPDPYLPMLAASKDPGGMLAVDIVSVGLMMPPSNSLMSTFMMQQVPVRARRGH